jgi:hypothetical protein
MGSAGKGVFLWWLESEDPQYLGVNFKGYIRRSLGFPTMK